MSAICGIVNLNGAPVDPGALDGMMTALSHRGRDRSHRVLAENVGFGHQMFCITPSSMDEVLPVHDPGKKVIITGDIRLDNRDDLLPLFGYSSEDSSLPDSSLVILSYERWGMDMVHHLIGQFVLALWDGRTNTLFLVTDHTGTRALFYHIGASQIIFASEIKAIHASGRVPRLVDKEHLAIHLAIPLAMHIRPDFTFFRDIRAMCAAHVIKVSPERFSEIHYWKPDIGKRLSVKSEDEWREAFQDLFFKVVKSKIRSCFPVASLLSGGLDSSSIVATASSILREKGQRLITVSSVAHDHWVGEVGDERDFIDQFKVYDNIDMHYIHGGQMGPFSDKNRWNDDTPLRLSRHFLYSALCQKVNEMGGRLLLEGSAGEHGPSYHGYGCLADAFIKGRWLYVLGEINGLARREGKRRSRVLFSDLFKPFLLRPASIHGHQWESTLRPEIKKEFLFKQIHREVLHGYMKDLDHLFKGQVNHRKRQVGVYLRKRVCWPRNSVEGYEKVQFSYPYSDPRIIEFCLATPETLKIRHGYRRYMIRSGMVGVLPEKIRLRTCKQPFSPDYHHRFIQQIGQAREWISGIGQDDPVHEIMDLKQMAETMDSVISRESKLGNRESLILSDIPRLVYLIHFLQRNPV